MAKQKIRPQDNAANTQNRNIGTIGQNKQVAQNQGNRGAQKNPQQKKK